GRVVTLKLGVGERPAGPMRHLGVSARSWTARTNTCSILEIQKWRVNGRLTSCGVFGSRTCRRLPPSPLRAHTHQHKDRSPDERCSVARRGALLSSAISGTADP